MASADRLDDDQVHVLHEGRVRRSRGPMLIGVVLLLAVAGAGAWVAFTDPFGESGAAVSADPAPDNLLGAAWSFESHEGERSESHWQTEDGAPGGFRVGSVGVVSGVSSGVAEIGPEGWARSISSESWRVEPGTGVELSGISSADGTQLFARFEADDRPALDVPLAAGRGRLSGRVAVPSGYRVLRVGLGAVGSGAVDDLVLKLLPQGEPAFERDTLGIFEVLSGGALGALVLRGQELVLAVRPPTLRPAAGSALPGLVGWMPGDGSAALRLADDGVVQASMQPALEGRELLLKTSLSGVPAGAVPLHEVLVSGSLAAAPVGIRSAGGYEVFSGDFKVDGIQALVLGRTQDRCELRLDRPFAASAVHHDDGSVALTLELPPASGGSVSLVLGLAADFSEQRVAAGQLRDEADRLEASGKLGGALAALDRIIADYPYDEQVLADARRHRAELTQQLTARLDALDADLDVALFLGSAQRCQEVRDDALAAAETFAGSDAEALFRERAEQVATRGASLLSSDLERRRQRIIALRDSFAAGGYPTVAAELSDDLDRFLAEPGETDR